MLQLLFPAIIIKQSTKLCMLNASYTYQTTQRNSALCQVSPLLYQPIVLCVKMLKTKCQLRAWRQAKPSEDFLVIIYASQITGPHNVTRLLAYGTGAEATKLQTRMNGIRPTDRPTDGHSALDDTHLNNITELQCERRTQGNNNK